MDTGTQNQVTAVVSLFNPDPTVVANCKVLGEEVGHIVVVDDGSPQDISGILDQLEALGIQVLRLESNSGIATALNAGITAALTSRIRPEFILTMDQDSVVDSGYTAALLKAYDQANADGVRVGIVAPGSISGLPTRRRGRIGSTLLSGEPIQSGLLIPCQTLDAVGHLLDELFIDGVDTELYLRIRSAGLEAVIAADAQLSHELGSFVTARFMGRGIFFGATPLQIRTAATYRYYYIFRNRLLLLRRYWRSQPVWAAAGLFSDYRHLAIVTLLAPGRTGRLRAALDGIRDGLRGQTGQRPPVA